MRLLGGSVDDPAAFHDFTVANWPAVEVEMRTRACAAARTSLGQPASRGLWAHVPGRPLSVPGTVRFDE